MSKKKKKVRPLLINMPKVPYTRERWMHNFLTAMLFKAIMEGEIDDDSTNLPM